ncbi:hypothetical protein MT49_2575 [Mycobacterium tuberculosis 49-02]|uniref:Uncharacterized protein n=1 Tax=Mycobacterium tuberculosis (strain CDC 1551 / Oshkosh) TaxID=83331 RepID=Q8VJK4_MYCTO|nr:hypothetical protein MT2424 [Mycobacterium tuberculosis CDC1551]CDM10719.1 hypothetical protein MT49_2575 [Mycobacterium tuberculosis 49-02]
MCPTLDAHQFEPTQVLRCLDAELARSSADPHPTTGI